MRLRTPLCCAICIASALVITGCAAVGVVADKVIGKPPIPAKYEPAPLAPLLVIAENYRDPSPSESDADRIARMVSKQLDAKKAATVVSPDKLATVRDVRPRDFARMSVVDIGKAVGAQQVIYVDLVGIGVGSQAGSDMLKGVATANVKVIDVTTGKVLFPVDLAEGYPVGYESPMRRATPEIGPDNIRGETLVGLSDRIARLFYKYQASDLETMDTGM